MRNELASGHGGLFDATRPEIHQSKGGFPPGRKAQKGSDQPKGKYVPPRAIDRDVCHTLDSLQSFSSGRHYSAESGGRLIQARGHGSL